MSDFVPTIYVKESCPFCLKVRIALIETGLGDEIKVREFTPGGENEAEIKEELAPHFEKVTFPSAQLEPGEYINDSDTIVSALIQKADAHPASLPVLNSYLNGAFKNLLELYRENRELKEKAS